MDFFTNLQEGFTDLTNGLYNSYDALKNSMTEEFGKINSSIGDGFATISRDLKGTVTDLQQGFEQFQDRLRLFMILLVLLILAIIAVQIWQVISAKVNERRQLRQNEMMLAELKEIRLLLERKQASKAADPVRAMRD